MVWPAEWKALRLADQFGYRGITAVQLAQKFPDYRDQERLFAIREHLKKIGNERIITKFIEKCENIQLSQCESIAKQVSKLKYITAEKLQCIFSTDLNLENALRAAADIDAFYAEIQGTQIGNDVEILETIGDGACFFRAIAYADTKEVRFTNSTDKKTMDDLLEYRDKFVHKVVEKWDQNIGEALRMCDIVMIEHGTETIDGYIEYMIQPGTWATQAEVIVGGDILGGLTVYQKPGGKWLKHTYGRENVCAIFYNGFDHYSAIHHTRGNS